MEEAVEICKLRLFLKLVAQVEPDAGKDNLGIEPLPDIDFNIRAGNTLVGYATADEVRRAFKEEPCEQGKLLLGTVRRLPAIRRTGRTGGPRVQAVPRHADRARHGRKGVRGRQSKPCASSLKALEEELNRYLAGEYGIERVRRQERAYAKWLKSHQPFHWFVEFYGIMSNGGFDVIIGNPPYVEYTPEKVTYTRFNEELFKTFPCKNLYALVCERSVQLAHKNSSLGLIVQLTALSSEEDASRYKIC